MGETGEREGGREPGKVVTVAFFMPLPTSRQRNYPTDRLTCWPGTSRNPEEGGLRSAAGPPTPAALLASDHLHSLSLQDFFFSLRSKLKLKAPSLVAIS